MSKENKRERVEKMIAKTKIQVMQSVGLQYDQMAEIKDNATRRAYFINFIMRLLDMARDSAFSCFAQEFGIDIDDDNEDGRD